MWLDLANGVSLFIGMSCASWGLLSTSPLLIAPLELCPATIMLKEGQSGLHEWTQGREPRCSSWEPAVPAGIWVRPFWMKQHICPSSWVLLHGSAQTKTPKKLQPNHQIVKIWHCCCLKPLCVGGGLLFRIVGRPNEMWDQIYVQCIFSSW